MQDTPESVYESFWKDLVETDGVMDPEKIKAELCDYRMVMQNAVKVYLHITNGKIGKLNTDPDVVCQIADECYEEQLEDGCPCHEPEPAKDTQRTDPPNCDWQRDEYGNWCCACSDTMPDFTPWKGTDPKGSFCPKCGKIIATKVHDQP